MTTRSGVENTSCTTSHGSTNGSGSAGPDDRLQGAQGRPDRQHPGRARRRREDRGEAHPRVRRPRLGLRPPRRGHAGEAPREAPRAPSTRSSWAGTCRRSCATCRSRSTSRRPGSATTTATVVRLFREYEFRTLIERLPPMAGETAEQRTERLRSVAPERLRPAASVAGRPEGWGPRGGDRPASSGGSSSASTSTRSGRRRPRGAASPTSSSAPRRSSPTATSRPRSPPRSSIRTHRGRRRRRCRRPRAVAHRRSPRSASRSSSTTRGRAAVRRWRCGRRRRWPDRRRRRCRGVRRPAPPARAARRIPLVGHEVKPLLVAARRRPRPRPPPADRVRHADRRRTS